MKPIVEARLRKVEKRFDVLAVESRRHLLYWKARHDLLSGEFRAVELRLKKSRVEVLRLRAWLRLVLSSASIDGTMSANWVASCCGDALSGKPAPRARKAKQ